MTDERTYIEFDKLLHGIEIFTRVDNSVQDELIRLQIDIRQEDVAFILNYLDLRKELIFPGHGGKGFSTQYTEAFLSMVEFDES